MFLFVLAVVGLKNSIENICFLRCSAIENRINEIIEVMTMTTMMIIMMMSLAMMIWVRVCIFCSFHCSISIVLEEGAIDEDENYIPPWEENDGYYGLLSRLVKTALPDLIWSVRASYDTNTLNKDQMVNHYARNGCFTTKVGLCSSLKNLPWFHSGCADEFYPRCYKVTHEDDKVAFIGKLIIIVVVFFQTNKSTIFLLLQMIIV